MLVKFGECRPLGDGFAGPKRGAEVYANMEQWAEIRRQVLVEGLSRREACRIYQLHWNTLQKILTHEEPPGYRRVKPVRRPIIEPVLPIIHQILTSDCRQPKKQRHTAKRIWQRLRDEHGFTGKYTVVTDAVRAWRQTQKEVFLPLSHPPGEAQVDFGFARVNLAGTDTEVALFVMSLPYSDAVYVQAFRRECTETFQEGHARAFAFFGGVPGRIAYDNAKTSVVKIIDTRDRDLTHEFQRLKSYYLFESHFCLVRRPNEKGHVERLVEYARSNFLVPVPAVDSLEQLNEQLTARCQQDQERTVRGRGVITTMLVDDRKAMLPLPARSFEARRVTVVTVDALSLVHFDTNSYSVPTAYAHRRVTVVATVNDVRLIHEDKLIARHDRCWDREQTLYNPIHYLALLERKPGGFDYAKPLESWHLPDCFDLLRRRLESDEKHGTRGFIRVLRLLEKQTLEQLTDAVEYALDIDVIDPDSIRVILDHRADRPTELFKLDGRPHLAGVRVAVTDLSGYASLLSDKSLSLSDMPMTVVEVLS
jgi:transposase